MLSRIKALAASFDREQRPVPDEARAPTEGLHVVQDVQLSSCFTREQDKTWQSGFIRRSDYATFTPRRANNLFSQHCASFPALEVKEIFPRAYFGGVLFPYYGHFLIESLARLPNIPDDGLPIVFMCLSDTVKEWHKLFFSDIGLDTRIRLTRKSQLMQVDEMIRVDQTTCIHADISRRFLDFTQTLFPAAPSLGKKIYLSRKLSPNAPVQHEDLLEEQLALLGFDIIQPEKLTIKKQVRLFDEAATVAGVEGSALHTLIFSSTPKHVMILPRRKTLDLNFVLQFAVQPRLRVEVLHCMQRYAETFSAPAELDVAAARQAIASAVERFAAAN